MASRKGAPDIRAAGAVLWRTNRRRIEIALVHRARYDDWSLPKGKLESGETELAAAVREVREETGSVVAVSRRLERTAYLVGKERKEVAYWLARHVSGEFARNDEVDELVWLGVREAKARLSYAVERTIVADLSTLPVPDAVVVLVRHAKAGKRGEWDGPDLERPLDVTGKRQAGRLAHFLPVFAPTRVLSAEPVRCLQTVTPFAKRAGIGVETDPLFGDAAFETSPDDCVQALIRLAQRGGVSVVASQGAAIPGLIEQIRPGRSSVETKKGSAWVLSFADGELLAADHYPGASR